MRIIAGTWRSRPLAAPPGQSTRPTADRVRQALFDMLLHAPWASRATIEGAQILDAFAGSGALGLEALSRGAAHATFLETDRAALATLRANIAACRAADRATLRQADATLPPPGRPCGLLFLDPPYGKSLIPAALAALDRAGWIAPGALLVAETARDEDLPPLGEMLADRAHGAARLTIWLTAARTAARSRPGSG
jgi:16S rRNA (guanine966-N2)-methyltransferase